MQTAEVAQFEGGEAGNSGKLGSRRRELRSSGQAEEEVGERPMARAGVRSRRGRPNGGGFQDMLLNIGGSDGALDRLIEQERWEEGAAHVEHEADLPEAEARQAAPAPPPRNVEPQARAAAATSKPPIHPAGGAWSWSCHQRLRCSSGCVEQPARCQALRVFSKRQALLRLGAGEQEGARARGQPGD